MNDKQIDPTADAIRHYEIQDALIERDYAEVGICSRRRYTATKAEHKAFWEAVDRRTEYVEHKPVAGDIIGYDRSCQPIYA
jgi:hypothetical protein